MLQANDQQLIGQLANAIREAASAKPSWLTYIPVVSAVISVVSVAISLWLTRSLARETRGFKLLPMIVFYRRAERVWTLKNVGEGTALEVFIRNYASENKVQDQVWLYPVAPGQEIRLDYLRGADKLVAGYVNIFGRDPHLTVCSKDVNEFKKGKLEPLEKSAITGHESDATRWQTTRLT
jgi:hypothetical protein